MIATAHQFELSRQAKKTLSGCERSGLISPFWRQHLPRAECLALGDCPFNRSTHPFCAAAPIVDAIEKEVDRAARMQTETNRLRHY